MRTRTITLTDVLLIVADVLLALIAFDVQL